MTHVCPVCGNETIETTCQDDIQGDGYMTGPVTFVEITAHECACDLTEEQVDAICAADLCEPDEPDYLERDAAREEMGK